MTRIDLDGEDPAAGLAALVLTVLDLLTDVLSREAVRRMETGRLSDAEIDQVGTALAEIEAEIDRLVAAYGVEEEVKSLRHDLDGLVQGAVRSAGSEETISSKPPNRFTNGESNDD